jgi:hypothetical protein
MFEISLDLERAFVERCPRTRTDVPGPAPPASADVEEA